VPAVRDLMHRGLVTCGPQMSLADAAALLVEHRVHALVVTEPDGAPVGVLSDTDLLAGEWLAGDAESLDALKRMTVGQLMSPGLETISADADAAEAGARLAARRLGRLVVLEDSVPVGVVAVSDLVAALARPPVERRTVADVMSRGFVACRPETQATALARAMTERRSRSVVVLATDGRPLGVVTGHDLLALVGGDRDPRADELMREPLTIEPQATLQEAADALLRHEVHRLLVLDPGDRGGVPLGIVSTSDVAAQMAAPGSIWH